MKSHSTSFSYARETRGGVNLLRNVSISVIMLIALLLPSRSMAQQTLCNSCPPAQTNYRVYWTSCKHQTTGLFCNSLDALCGEEFKICCDPLTGARYTLFTGNVQIGGTCPDNCKQECP